MTTEDYKLYSKLLRDGEHYWVKQDIEWQIARYDEKFKQFHFTDCSVCDFPNLFDVDPQPIIREDRTDRLSGQPLDPQ